MRHKFAATWTYDTPSISGWNPILRALLNTYQFNGSFIAQTGQPVTILSPYDANANGDPAGDRAIFNPFASGITDQRCVWGLQRGAGGATSIVDLNTTNCSAANIVGYVAIDPIGPLYRCASRGEV